MNFPNCEKTMYERLLDTFEFDDIILLFDTEREFYHQLKKELYEHGYNYPELIDWSTKVLEDLQQLERWRKIHKLYNKQKTNNRHYNDIP